MDSLNPALPLTPPWQSLELHPRLVRMVPMSRVKLKVGSALAAETRMEARSVSSPTRTWRVVFPTPMAVTRPAGSTSATPPPVTENTLREVTSRSSPSFPFANTRKR